MLSHIIDNEYQIRPGAAAGTLMQDVEPLVEMQENTGFKSSLCILALLSIRQYTEGWTMEN